MLRGKGRTLEDHAGLDEARVPRHAGELPPAAVKFVAAQVKVDPAMLAGYVVGSDGRVSPGAAQGRAGFRERVAGDEDKLADWLAAEVCRAEPNRDRAIHCGHRVEPQGTGHDPVMPTLDLRRDALRLDRGPITLREYSHYAAEFRSPTPYPQLMALPY